MPLLIIILSLVGLLFAFFVLETDVLEGAGCFLLSLDLAALDVDVFFVLETDDFFLLATGVFFVEEAVVFFVFF